MTSLSSGMQSVPTLKATPAPPRTLLPGLLPAPSLMQTSTFLPPWIEQGSPRSTLEAPHAFVFHARPRSASPSPTQRQATWAAPMRVQAVFPVANPCEGPAMGSPRQALMQPVRVVRPRSAQMAVSPSQASSIEPRKQAAKDMCNILKVLVLRKMASGFARLLRHMKEDELMDFGAVELLTRLNNYDELAQRPGRVGAILSTALQTEGQRIASHCSSILFGSKNTLLSLLSYQSALTATCASKQRFLYFSFASFMDQGSKWQAVHQPFDGHELQAGGLMMNKTLPCLLLCCLPGWNFGCKDGRLCNFCHMPHSEEWLERAAALREQRRAERRRALEHRQAQGTSGHARSGKSSYYGEVRSWEGGEPHMQNPPGRFQGHRHQLPEATHMLGFDAGPQQTLMVPDQLPIFECKGTGKGKKSKTSSKGKGQAKGSKRPGGYTNAESLPQFP
eukprot:symbB.v1.2.017733.t1/scaffold1366.1/size123243/9